MQDWRRLLTRDPAGFYLLDPAVTCGVPVRLFLTEALLEGAEEGLYQQILNACAFPGVRAVAITPDVHFGFGVPIGCVIATDGTLAMGPVGFDIGCGMMAARSDVDVREATPEKRLAFNREVMRHVETGAGAPGGPRRHRGRPRHHGEPDLQLGSSPASRPTARQPTGIPTSTWSSPTAASGPTPLCHPGMRAVGSAALPLADRGPAHHLSVHRGLVRPTSAALRARPTVADGL